MSVSIRQFSEALQLHEEHLRTLDRLREELATLGVAHNNLKVENLAWEKNHLVVLRPWHATIGGDRTGDLAALETLSRVAEETGQVNDYEAPYETEPTNGWCGHEFEGLICFQAEQATATRIAQGRWSSRRNTYGQVIFTRVVPSWRPPRVWG